MLLMIFGKCASDRMCLQASCKKLIKVIIHLPNNLEKYPQNVLARQKKSPKALLWLDFGLSIFIQTLQRLTLFV